MKKIAESFRTGFTRFQYFTGIFIDLSQMFISSRYCCLQVLGLSYRVILLLHNFDFEKGMKRYQIAQYWWPFQSTSMRKYRIFFLVFGKILCCSCYIVPSCWNNISFQSKSLIFRNKKLRIDL